MLFSDTSLQFSEFSKFCTASFCQVFHSDHVTCAAENHGHRLRITWWHYNEAWPWKWVYFYHLCSRQLINWPHPSPNPKDHLKILLLSQSLPWYLSISCISYISFQPQKYFASLPWLSIHLTNLTNISIYQALSVYPGTDLEVKAVKKTDKNAAFESLHSNRSE